MRKLPIYCFLVLGFIYGCEEIISVPDISEERVEVLAPSDGVVLENTEVIFSWSKLDFAEEYQVQIAQPDFVGASQIVLDTIIGDSLGTIRTFTKSLESNSFQWRIRGLNSSYMTEYTSNGFIVEVEELPEEEEAEEEIVIVDISEESVILTAPSDGLVLDNTTLNFSWEDVQDATSYRLQVAFPNFESPVQVVVDEILETTTTAPFSLEDDTLYQWRVKAINEESETSYSTRSFSINTTEDFSEQTVTIISPKDNFETTETSVLLSWELLDEATLYRIVIVDLSNDIVFLEQAITEANVTVEFKPGVYSWAVRAENDTENTAYTEQTITIIE